MYQPILTWIYQEVGKAELGIIDSRKILHVDTQDVDSRSNKRVDQQRFSRAATRLFLVFHLIFQEVRTDTLHVLPGAIADTANAANHVSEMRIDGSHCGGV